MYWLFQEQLSGSTDFDPNMGEKDVHGAVRHHSHVLRPDKQHSHARWLVKHHDYLAVEKSSMKPCHWQH